MSLIINTLVVDDEPLAQALVAGYVGLAPFLSLVGCCSSASEATARIAEGGVDLVLLDIQMPGISGLTVAKSLVGVGNPKVIFTTAYGEYAIDGFKLDIVDYLLKPFDFDEFMRAVNKTRHLIELERGADAATENASVQPSDEQKAGADDFFFVKSEYKLVKIEISKILYVEGLKDYVKIYMSDSAKAVLTLATLKQMETSLMPYSFVRLHRSFIVNVKMITGVERGVVLIGEARIPVGEGYKQNFQVLLDKLTL